MRARKVIVTTMLRTLLRAPLLAAILAPLSLLAAGCAPAPRGDPADSPARAGPPVLDGDISEWGDASVLADGQYLYVRWSTGRADYPPQAAPYTTAILLDLDDSAATGLMRSAGGEVLGVDLEVLLSPGGNEGTQAGVRIAAVSAAGERTPIPHAEAGFSFCPTYAATWFEGRLSRSLPTGAISGPAVVGVVAIVDHEGRVLGESEAFRRRLPARMASVPSGQIPAPGAETLRVVSYNVLKSGPVARPEPFERILRALAPDVVLLQEWDDRASIDPWFNTRLGDLGRWYVRAGEGGVAIASRHPLEEAGPDAVVIAPEGPEGRGYRPVRVVAGLARTPIGDVLVSSLHLKCCGTAGGVEDRARLAEARAVNAAVLKGIDDQRVSHVVIGGDFNLVGSRPPLDLARAALDADGSDLAIADARVLGDRAYDTWSDARSAFGPGRLDFLAFSDASAQAARAFVVDTARLGRAALGASGLLPGDSAAASDHLPVVVDLRSR